ncbi:MAG: 5-(carboxyamino)imidazole ribonucleotide synthase [Phycisphaerales bacterium JB050]
MPDLQPEPAHAASIVAVLGAGQLGRMLALAGVPLGLRFRFLDPDPHPPAAAVGEHIRAAFDDTDALEALIDGADTLTFEFENVPARVVGFISDHLRDHGALPPAPPARALAVAQDRLEEKQLFQTLRIPVPGFFAIDSRKDLDGAIAELGLPLVVKTRRGGYDGKGQFVLRNAAHADACWQQLSHACETGKGGLIAEAFVPFTRELSIVAVRARDGSTACYPLIENHHEGGILRQSIAPAPSVSPDLQQRAETHARNLLDELDYVGVLTLELFEVQEGTESRVIANEMAPRVHNSAHLTIEASVTSQFENHIRAITGLPLGPTEMKPGVERAVMLNLIGKSTLAEEILAAVPDAHPHLYAKSPRPGRKLGHITLINPTETDLQALTALIGSGDPA